MVDGIETLEPAFYNRETSSVARDLLGKLLVRFLDGEVRVGRIVEAEAYGQEDPASHSFRGPTPRSRVMFGPPGFAYVYLIYGMYHCLNAVTEEAGRGGAVLIRAAEPLSGLSSMWKDRFPQEAVPEALSEEAGAPSPPADSGHARGRGREKLAARLASGPGKLCRAFGITKEHNGLPLFEGTLLIARRVGGSVAFDADRELEIAEDGRIGISRATDTAWRFSVAGSRYVSRKPAANARHLRHVAAL